MIFDVLYIIFLFVLSIGILPLGVLAAWNYSRSKRTVVEGMARLDANTLDRLGWEARGYIGAFDLRAPFRMGWNTWGLAVQKQNVALQRTLLRGLPTGVDVSDETRKSVRRFRRYFSFFVVPVAVIILFPAYIRLSHDLASFSGLPLYACFILLGLGVALFIFNPPEKFQRWPEIENQT
ncbi:MULTISPECIES: hypothetical protein [unclassified Ruegeria]|uniref:hypothetical protein n=1 Tax=unclassified Ruegeria TaxID=2625375 RepID=UPI001ADACDD8|nr:MULTISPECIES: hypothetical protein [unclassified Ruegeria]MBO9411593.1 hypothetical protein [Ruegeria sp. R8_1]MBO9415845.1 hypothetical protein [Ruegeria sp. R8_2]